MYNDGLIQELSQSMARLRLDLIDNTLHAHGTVEWCHHVDPLNTVEQSYAMCAGWSYRDGILDLFADHVGMIPVFVYRTGTSIVITSSLEEMVEAIPDPVLDQDAIAVFLRMSYFIGDDTPVKNVRILSPGFHQTITADTFADTWPQWLPQQFTPFSGTRKEAIETYGALFEESIRKRILPDNLVVPLSGGRDSRHAFLEYIWQGKNPHVAVTAKTNRDDIDISKQLTRLYQIPHEIVELEHRNIVEDEVEKNKLLHHMSHQHSWYLKVVEKLLDFKPCYIVDGLAGDVLSNGDYFKEDVLHACRAGDLEKAVDILLPAPVLSYLSPALQNQFSEQRAKARMRQELAKHANQPNPLSSFFFWSRTRRSISLSPICLAEKLNVSLPYLDVDLLGFFFSLPGEQYGKAGFHDEVIKARYPEEKHNIRYDKKPIKPVLPPRFGKDWQGIGKVFKLGMQEPYTNKLFVLTRALRTLVSGRENKEYWWVFNILFLDGLKRMGVTVNKTN